MVRNHTSADLIKVLESRDKLGAIEELALLFTGKDLCPDIDGLISALKERETIMSTGIGFGIAIPHAKISAVTRTAFAIGVSPAGIDFDSMDGMPVHLVILVIASDRQHKEYLKLLSTIMAILKQTSIREQIIASRSPEEIIGLLSH